MRHLRFRDRASTFPQQFGSLWLLEGESGDSAFLWRRYQRDPCQQSDWLVAMQLTAQAHRMKLDTTIRAAHDLSNRGASA